MQHGFRNRFFRNGMAATNPGKVRFRGLPGRPITTIRSRVAAFIAAANSANQPANALIF